MGPDPGDSAARGRQGFFFSNTLNLSWDERYRNRPASTDPSAFLIECTRFRPSTGAALDLACGGGRNSVFLAQRGLRVTGVDLSREALQQGRELARKGNVHVDWVQADLIEFPIASAAFDLVIVFYYRNPNLYSRLREALRPGGILVYQTFTLDQLQFEVGPKNPDHLLRPGELRKPFSHWELIFYRESHLESGLASLVARRAE